MDTGEAPAVLSSRPGAAKTRQVKTTAAESLFGSDEAASTVARGRDFEYDTCDNEFTFKQGAKTGLLFLDPRPAEEELGRIYPRDYLPYRFDELPPLIQKARDFVQRGKVRNIARLVSPDARILDVGCGSGSLLRLLRRHGSPSWRLYANDLNEKVLRRLESEGFSICPGRVEGVRPLETLDAVILNQVIEHFSNIRGILSAIHNLLAPGGIVFIETPSIEGLDAKLFGGRYWGGYHFPRHWYLFSARLLRRLLEESGFEVVAEEYLASPSFWIQSLHHFFLDKGFPRLAGFFDVKNPFLLAPFTLFDTLTAFIGGKTSNMRVVACKRP